MSEESGAPGVRSFFVPDGDAFQATQWTRGPWSNEHQHGGPPAALMARAMERMAGPGMAVVRLTVEFFRPVPVARVEVAVEVTKQGRKASWFATRLTSGGKDVCRASAVAIRRTTLPIPEPALTGVSSAGDDGESPPGAPRTRVGLTPPEESPAFTFPFFRAPEGYHTAMEVRIARGTWSSGALAAWMRMRYPLLPDEEPSPLQRVTCAADSGGGVSKVLDIDRFTFMNPDLSIYLHREAEGEWVCLDARTTARPSGLGLVETELSDRRGPIGRALQSLVIDERADQSG